jgi:hypothetical protein
MLAMADASPKPPETLLAGLGKHVGAFVFGIIAAVLATVLGWWLTTNVLASKEPALKILEVTPASNSITSNGFSSTVDFDVTVLNDGTATAERCTVELEALGGSDNPFERPDDPLGTVMSGIFGLEAGAKRTINMQLFVPLGAVPTPDIQSFYQSMSVAVNVHVDCPNAARATFSDSYFFGIDRLP